MPDDTSGGGGDIYAQAAAFRRALLAGERETAKQMISSYGVVWQATRARLDALTGQIAAARAAGEDVTPGWLVRQQRYTDLLQQTQNQLKLWAGVASGQISAGRQAAIAAGLRDASALLGTSFNLLPVRPIETATAFLANGAPLSDHLAALAPQTVDGIKTALIAGVATGQNARAIAREVRAASALPLDRALTISRTETMRSYRTATQATYQAAGDLVVGWRWLASLSSRSCPVCLAMHGTIHPVDEPMETHPCCRCTQVAVLAGDEGKPFETGEAWLQRQPEKVQNDVLGDAAAKAWRDGRVSLADFVGTKRSPVWGGSRYTLSLQNALRIASGSGAPGGSGGSGSGGGSSAPGSGSPSPPPSSPPSPAPANVVGTQVAPNAPVSAALDVRASGAIGTAIRDAIAAVDSVHRDGELLVTPIKDTASGGFFGAYAFSRPDPATGIITPGNIEVSRTSPTYGLTTAHEVGHFIDQQIFGARTGFASDDVNNKAMDGWRQAAASSAAVRKLDSYIQTGRVDLIKPDGSMMKVGLNWQARNHVDYLLERHEVWARSYAQYIAVRSGDASLLRQLDSKRVQTPGDIYLPVQWEDGDFAPIAAAIDALLTAKGMRP